MTAYVIADDCVPKDLYLCVRDQCSRTVASVKAKLHLMLRPYYIFTRRLVVGRRFLREIPVLATE